MTKIKTIAVAKTDKSGTTASGTSTIITGGVGSYDLISANTVNADRVNADSVSVSELTGGNVNVTSVNTQNTTTVNLSSQNISSKKIITGYVSADDLVSQSITSDTIKGTDNYLDNIYNKKIKSADAEIDYAYISKLLSDNINVKNLTVTGAAHFFELIIDQIKSAGGALLLTPADGFKLDAYMIDPDEKDCMLLWKCEEDSKGRYNKWQVNDQAICMSFNNAKVGTTYNVSNKYWWSRVLRVSGDKPIYGCYFNNEFYYDYDNYSYTMSGKSFSYSKLNSKDRRGDWTLAEYPIYLYNTVSADGYYDFKYVDDYNNLSAEDKAKYTKFESGTTYFTRIHNETYRFIKKTYYDTLSNFSQSDCEKYHYIMICYKNNDLGKNTYDSSSVFNLEIGDNIAMLGYQGTDDVQRQSAIYISAYDSLDSGLKAPLIAQYQGINDFNLTSHRRSYFDATSAEFIGSFKVISNGTESSLAKYIEDTAHNVATVVSSTAVTYQSSTSGTITPTGEWSSTIPTVKEGDYLWTRTIVNYSDGNSTTAYSVSHIGVNGTSITISSVSTSYAISKTSTKPDDSSFTNTDIPTLSEGDYLWSKTTVNYSDSKSTVSYSVSRIGSDGNNGDQGAPGIDGKTTYIHLAYSNSSDGSKNFSTTYFDNALYIGTRTDETQTDSQTYTDYKWSRLRGEDGTNGKDGKDGTSVTINSTNVSYAVSQTSDRPSEGWQDTMPVVAVGSYLWTRTIVNYSDNNSTTSYSVSRVGEDGTSVTITSISTTYAASTTSMQPADSEFTSDSVPTLSKGDYLWSKTIVKYSDGNYSTSYSVSRIGSDGTNGDKGADGKDGKSTYIHIAYANSADGSQNFSTTYFADALYIGTLTDEKISDSQTYSDYKWLRMRGSDGKDGTNGKDGSNGSSVVINSTTISYAEGSSGTITPISGWQTTIPTITAGNYLWTRTIVNYSDGNSTTSYSVSHIGENGTNGTDGTNGTSVSITSTLTTYAISKTSTKPSDSSFTSTTVPDLSTGDYLWSKTVVNYSDSKSTVSYSVSRIGSDGSNGDPGAAGADGKTTYVHIAYANSADGSSSFSTTYFTNAAYIGTRTDETQQDSQTYSDYTWARLLGQPGADGKDGNDGKDGTNGKDGAAGTSVVISSTFIEYNVSSSATIAPVDGWTTTIPSVATGSYLWTRTTVNYSDGNKTVSYTVSRQANDGTGTSVTINSTSVTYAISKTSTKPDDSSFTYTSIPELSQGVYLWCKTIVKYSDGTDVVSYTVSRIGSDGSNGDRGPAGADGKTTYVHFAYANSSDGITNFSTTYFTGALYIGTRTDETESDSQHYYDYTWSRLRGEDGSKGADGKDGTNGTNGTSITISSTYIYYQVSTSGTITPTSNWSNTIPSTIPEGQYLWCKTIVNYSDGTSTNTYTVARQGVNGSNGSDGTDGKDGKDGTSITITSTSISYAVTNNGTQPSDSSFTYSSIPSLSQGQYLWTLTTVNYSDGNSTKSYSVSRIGSDGSDGTPGAKGADGKTTYLHIAYANSGSGDLDFSTTFFAGALYIGFLTNETQSDSQTYSDYDWSRLRGDKGDTGADGKDGTNGTNGTDGKDGTNGTNGADADYYKLIDIGSYASVDTTKQTIHLAYQLVHVVGNTLTYLTSLPDSYNLEWFFTEDSGNPYTITYSTTSHCWLYDNGSDTYVYNSSKNYITVTLNKSNIIQESKVIPIMLLAGATFTVTDSIKATVQGHTTQLSAMDGRITTNTNGISTVSQKYDSISATVKSNTTEIDNLDGRVTNTETNVSNVTQTATSLTSTVQSHTSSINNLNGQVGTNTTNISQIKQEADNIKIGVNDTGINIDTHTITLDATKTIVKGNLTINNKVNGGEGLTIFDSDGIPRVELRTSDISDMTAIVDGSTGSMSGSQTIYCAAISHITIEDGLRDYVLQSATQNLGKYNVGDKIDIKKWYITHNSTYNEQLTYTITLQRDNKSATNIVVKSDTIDIVNSYAVITVDDYSYTVTTAGEYNLIFDYKVNLNTYTVDDPVSHVAYMTLTRTSSQIVVIGKDGMAALSDTNKWVYIGRDKTEIRWGVDKGIKFDSSAVWQRHPTTDGLGAWGPIGCYRHIDAVTVSDSNNPYYVTDATDTLISTSAAGNYIYVPDAQAYNGRVITVIDKNTAELHIAFNNKSYISANSNDKVNNQWITMDGNCVRRFTYISSLSAWVEEKMD